MKNFQKCDRVSVVALSLSVFLGIFAFIPGGLIPSGALKGYLLFASVFVALISWLIGRLIEGSFRIPWTPVLGASAFFVLTLFLSALFAHAPYLSFFGEGFDQGTFAMLGAFLLLLILASMLFTTHKRLSIFLKGFFTVYAIVAVFQLIHVIFPSFTTLSVFYNRVDSPVGIWSDFAFISGAALIGSVLMLQFAKPSRRMRPLLAVCGILGLFFVVLANIFMVWVLVGFSSILILVYTLISNRFKEGRYFPFLAFTLTLVALLFILANNLFGGILANYLGASFIDVHPSLSATLHTSASSLAAHPVLGAGPNHFLKEWLSYRPTAVNTNTLWDVPFSSGVSFLGTVAVLGGGLGIIAVILFLLAFGYESGRSTFALNEEHPAGVLPVFGVFVLALYFLLAVVIFSPGTPVVVAAFMFVGIFIGTLIGEGRIREREVHFLKDQRSSFFSILAIVALLLVSAGAVYAATVRFGAITFFQKSISDVQLGDLDKANANISKAIALSDLPIFERSRVLYAEQSIQKTFGASNSASSDTVRAVLQNAISIGNVAARSAIALDPSDPGNYLVFGDFLRLLVPLKIDGVPAAAVDAYQQAITIAPRYPKSYLNLAELYFDTGDNDNARLYVNKALAEKSNYTDAYFLLAQIEIAEGNTNTAISRIQDATVIDPSNPDTYFELGYLRYNSGDYTNAIDAFHTTLGLNPQYLNAWYYLALADRKTGNYTEATTILAALHKQLPDNQAVSDALNPSPASYVAPTPDTSSITPGPVTTTKEKSKKLPLPSTTKGTQ